MGRGSLAYRPGATVWVTVVESTNIDRTGAVKPIGKGLATRHAIRIRRIGIRAQQAAAIWIPGIVGVAAISEATIVAAASEGTSSGLATSGARIGIAGKRDFRNRKVGDRREHHRHGDVESRKKWQ